MKGILLVISAPSGAGKTTVCSEFLKVNTDVSYALSTTTRQPREGEVDGVDYFFISQEEFEHKIKQGLFLEYARVFNQYYGTSKEFVLSHLANGKHVLIDVDVQGATQIRSVLSDVVQIFILPPDLNELENRLVTRGKDSSETIKLRLSEAQKEISKSYEYDYVIVNDTIENAVKQLQHIFESEKLRVKYNKECIRRLIGSV